MDSAVSKKKKKNKEKALLAIHLAVLSNTPMSVMPNHKLAGKRLRGEDKKRGKEKNIQVSYNCGCSKLLFYTE
jgi:hypothetical protein